MKFRVVAAAFAAWGSFSAAAFAADLPAIRSSKSNAVPACATPGRMMAFAASRNAKLDTRFDQTATEYMRHGETLAVRWDYAFFQMLVETANLSFVGDVKPSQYNFAGLGATGGGEPGEKFKSLSEGVKAHLQHVLMYAGEQVSDPVAERTRKVQEWGILTSWQKSIKGPMTFEHLTRKWSPKDRGYARDIASVGEAFYSRFCDKPDPRPELAAAARGKTGVTVAAAEIKSDATSDDAAAEVARAKARAIAERAIADTRETSGPNRFGLGAGSLGATVPQPPSAAPPSAGFTILNAEAAQPAPSSESKTPQADPAANAAAPAKPAETVVAAAAKNGCRVWQASYGGQKAVIIKAMDDGQTNYTVLDVNEGREQREVDAYIAAYAKNGASLGEYQTSNKALNKAFELCPEG